MKPVLIMMSAGQREYREPMLRRIADRYSVVLVSPETVTWEKPYLLDHLVVRPSDPDGFVLGTLGLAERYQVSGVLTYDEWCVEMASAAAESLGVPHCRPAAAARCRDKWAAREALRVASVPSARSELVGTMDEALRAADRIGYPVVVKPRALSASFGVSRVADPADLPAAFERAYSVEPKRAWRHPYGVLVEECLDGPEISVDSVVSAGNLETVAHARKVLGYPPHFEEIGHVVASSEKIVRDPSEVRAVVHAAHQALGIDNAVTHTELRLTATGPRVVEVNGRMGGDLIPELALAATGVDLGVAAADLATGRKPRLSPTRDVVVGIRFLYADASGVVAARGIPPDVAASPWMERVVWLVQPGATVCPEPGRRYFARVGFAVVTAQSVRECEERMDMVAERFTFQVAPPATAAS